MADGYNSNYEVVINLKGSDQDHLSKFLKAIDGDQEIKLRDKESVCSVRISSKKMCLDLEEKGCIKAKSLVLEFPIDCFHPSLMRHFVRGYFDGDGCIYVDKKGHRRVTFFSGSVKFIDGLEKYFEQAGLSGFARYKDSRFLVCSNKKGVDKIEEFMYEKASIFIERKRTKFNVRKCHVTAEEHWFHGNAGETNELRTIS